MKGAVQQSSADETNVRTDQKKALIVNWYEKLDPNTLKNILLLSCVHVSKVLFHSINRFPKK